jgi:hypothetical protein
MVSVIQVCHWWPVGAPAGFGEVEDDVDAGEGEEDVERVLSGQAGFEGVEIGIRCWTIVRKAVARRCWLVSHSAAMSGSAPFHEGGRGARWGRQGTWHVPGFGSSVLGGTFGGTRGKVT